MSEQCKYMRAAYPTLADDDLCADHRHDEPTFALARAMAAVFQGENPGDEQIAWFLDDAAAVVDDFNPTPNQWVIQNGGYPKESGLDHQFTLNGVPYVIQEADWEPDHPIKRETWDSWVGVDDYEESSDDPR